MSDFSGVVAAAAEVEAYCRSQGWKLCFLDKQMSTVDERLKP